jgi:Ubiquitin 3 binding protein But2 C-terminal domain
MKYALATVAFGLGVASAATLPRDSCSFTLTASGGQSGTVGQLSDGQNRVGGSNPKGTYTISNGQITDSQGRGCILTPTTQFQCDVGATPTGGFFICNGQVEYNGSPTFYACPASDSEYNIYTTPVSGQNKCVKIELTASGCDTCAASSGSAASKPPTASQQPSKQPTQTIVSTAQQSCPAPSTVTVTFTQPAASAPPAKSSQAPAPSKQPTSAPVPKQSTTAPVSPPSSTGKTCPADLSGSYQYPHLIVPVSKSSPNKAYGTQYNGTVTSDISTIFNFDVPPSYTGTCSLVFLFPKQSQLETSSYTFSGNGEIDFKQLSTIASQSTTYASQGSVSTDYGSKTVTPGSSTVVATFACPAGKTVSYELSSVSGTSLNFFQDYNPSPIGLYITSC